MIKIAISNILIFLLNTVSVLIAAYYFGPENYGQIAFFLGIQAIIAPIMNFSLNHRIFDNSFLAKKFLLFSLLIVSSIILMLYLALLLLTGINLPIHKVHNAVILTAGMESCFYLILTYLVMKEEYELYLQQAIIFVVSALIIRLFIIVLFNDVTMYLSTYAIPYIISSLALCYRLALFTEFKKPNFYKFFHYKFKSEFLNNLHTYKLTFAQIIGTFNLSFITLFLGFNEQNRILGQYSIGRSISNIPAQIFSRIIYDRANTSKDGQVAAHKFEYNIIIGGIVSFFVLLLSLALIVKNYYPIEQWTLVPDLIFYISFQLFTSILVRPAFAWLNRNHRYSFIVIYNAIALSLTMLVMVFLSTKLSMQMTISACCFASGIMNLLLLLYIRKEKAK